MDEAQREYLDAINRMVVNTTAPLTDAVIWLQYMTALASNPAMCEQGVEEDAVIADDFLYEFRCRFRAE